MNSKWLFRWWFYSFITRAFLNDLNIFFIILPLVKIFNKKPVSECLQKKLFFYQSRNFMKKEQTTMENYSKDNWLRNKCYDKGYGIEVILFLKNRDGVQTWRETANDVCTWIFCCKWDTWMSVLCHTRRVCDSATIRAIDILFHIGSKSNFFDRVALKKRKKTRNWSSINIRLTRLFSSVWSPGHFRFSINGINIARNKLNYKLIQ